MDSLDYQLSSYNYHLDAERIAQKPTEPRHAAKMLVVRKNNKSSYFSNNIKVWDIQNELNSGDLLILNDTRVLKARLRIRLNTGSLGELLLLDPLGNGIWLCLAKPGRKFRKGENIFLEKEGLPSIELGVVDIDKDIGGRLIQFPCEFSDFEQIEKLLEKYGEVPLPPYIKNLNNNDSQRYQTLYASRPGAIAAPTAGLHLSDELLKNLKNKGINQASVTLHVGIGTFRPIEVEDLTKLELHREWVEVKEEVIKAIEHCHNSGGRVFAVGTTSVRALESAYLFGKGKLKPITGKVDLVIKPGFKFGVIDGLLTNFHLPKSSLLLLVSALIGRRRLLDLYSYAIEENYSFFSYGDAMLIKPDAVLDSARY